MQTDTYSKLLESIKHLTPEEQLRLREDLDAIIRSSEENEPLHDVMEFMGFAEELWKGVDIQKYIDEERSSWGGFDEVRKSWDG